ncbi:mitochondrial glutamate carrier 2 isoform X2 [Macaca thibetana thibetana]|uniref:mitochondrial glutamate carrier 2 isoform X2 n=1 Tax=Macaca thibetana thibetana TaxID=257877 RepID=UPI0021BCB441|nr:mitochondrial glutamate carrier 2 isoform X2 [Macaca thibetana thibetana]
MNIDSQASFHSAAIWTISWVPEKAEVLAESSQPQQRLPQGASSPVSWDPQSLQNGPPRSEHHSQTHQWRCSRARGGDLRVPHRLGQDSPAEPAWESHVQRNDRLPDEDGSGRGLLRHVPRGCCEPHSGHSGEGHQAGRQRLLPAAAHGRWDAAEPEDGDACRVWGWDVPGGGDLSHGNAQDSAAGCWTLGRPSSGLSLSTLRLQVLHNGFGFHPQTPLCHPHRPGAAPHPGPGWALQGPGCHPPQRYPLLHHLLPTVRQP